MSLAEMTDVAYVEHLLKAGPITNAEIQRRSYADRGVGLHVNNRISDIRLRRQRTGEGGVQATRLSDAGRRQIWRYELTYGNTLFDRSVA